MLWVGGQKERRGKGWVRDSEKKRARERARGSEEGRGREQGRDKGGREIEKGEGRER